MAHIFRQEHNIRGGMTAPFPRAARRFYGPARHRGDASHGQVETLTPCVPSTIVRAMTGHNHIFGICREIIS
jgi:hypothetical protein